MTRIAKTSDATDASRIIFSMDFSPDSVSPCHRDLTKRENRVTHCPFRSGTLDPADPARKARPVKLPLYCRAGSREVTESQLEGLRTRRADRRTQRGIHLPLKYCAAGALDRRTRRREARQERGNFQDERDRAGAQAGPEI